MEWLTTPEGWISLMTLTLLEIVLGIDNIVFISILASKLPKADQATARKLGLGMAPLSADCVSHGDRMDRQPYPTSINPLGKSFSGRDLILLLGGLSSSPRQPMRSMKSSRELMEKQIPKTRSPSPVY